jgi:uncharacterized protein
MSNAAKASPWKETDASLVQHVKEVMAGREPSHDFLHVVRVASHAVRLAMVVSANVDVVRTAALLHELVTFKKNDPRSSTAGDVCAQAAQALLLERGADADFARSVAHAIRDHAFSKGSAPSTLESAVLQDADRLDAIGAIGIARCFATAADMKSAFYEQNEPFAVTRALDDKSYAVDHFEKKLLLLQERMHTAPAREEAARRTEFLRTYLKELRAEIG